MNISKWLIAYVLLFAFTSFLTGYMVAKEEMCHSPINIAEQMK